VAVPDVAAEVEKANAETRAWLAESDGADWFVKFVPSELIEGRAQVEIAISGAGLHPAIVPLRQVVHVRDGVLLIYDRVRGESLGSPEARAQFYALPLSERVSALITLFNALAAVTEAGWVLVDFYEGNVMYDYDARRVYVFDWDLCRKGDGFTLEMERNYGSSRLMPPEEFQKGAWIDGQSNVFTLGRVAMLTLGDNAGPFTPILARATAPNRLHRYETVADFTRDFARIGVPS
jgi:serine/threonine-protein kinase